MKEMESMWQKTKTDLETVNWRGHPIHLKSVPAMKNVKTGEVYYYPSDVAKAEINLLAKKTGLKSRDVPLLLMLVAKPGVFQKGIIQYKYQINKMLFYQWKEMEKLGLGETFPHDKFESAPRGPVPKNLGDDLKRLEEKGIVTLSYKKWGKGKKEASLETQLTEKGINIAHSLVGEIPDNLKDVTATVKKQLFCLDPATICKKVHEEYPEYRKTYTELDRD
jgi:hypothetical protein